MLDQSAAPSAANKTIFLKDYRTPNFLVDTVALDFELGETVTSVISKLTLRRNADGETHAPLVLDGEQLELTCLELDGKQLDETEYQLVGDQLIVAEVPDKFELVSTVLIKPQENTQLSGLYKSSGNFCTQCEAEGFRRITFFPDRPDVLSIFSVRIVADHKLYPVLLSNGNPTEKGEMDDGRHWAQWEDPWPKPSYLFALVAGDLGQIEDSFVTMGGKEIILRIYTEHHNVEKCDHAMRSLRKSMQWDEEVYGREYDLDVYNIVAVDDFNMGAMENKGLNVFNSKYVLALPETATDADYEGIESVIGHEYFHNWSGNRVTCRDWFQLSLKEGFTVFRDQEFSADMGSRGVKRIRDVRVLRSAQFAEDAGPMAHPIRPDSYEEINNFYTVTVYNKGAEVVRMLRHIVGSEQFRTGTDLYFERHDGQAVTTEDFVKAIEDANDLQLEQFRLWYSQAGTPEVQAQTEFDSGAGTALLTFSQTCPDMPGQKDKLPFQIPLVVEAYDQNGNRLIEETTLSLTESRQEFTFSDLATRPIFSVLRGFSAPIKLAFASEPEDSNVLMRFDSDPFNRWECFQNQFKALMIDSMEAPSTLTTDMLPTALIEALIDVLHGDDNALAAEIMSLPPESYIASFCKPIDPQAIYEVRRALTTALAQRLESEFLLAYQKCTVEGSEYRVEPADIGKRALRNRCLGYLLELKHKDYTTLALEQFESSDCMTDTLAALSGLVSSQYSDLDSLLESFFVIWRDEPLVVDKWLSLQAMAPTNDVLDKVVALRKHEAFSISNPNKVRALFGAFASANATGFHRLDGAGYRFIADAIIELDPVNPQTAARLMSAFNQWRKYRPDLAAKMKQQIERIYATANLSADVSELASKALA